MATRARDHEKILRTAKAEVADAIQALRRQLDGLVSEASEVAETDFSEEGGDPDVGVIERDRIRSRIAENEDRLAAFERAEAAVADGTYGTCKVCGNEIPAERLEVMPETRLCVQCKAAGHQN